MYVPGREHLNTRYLLGMYKLSSNYCKYQVHIVSGSQVTSMCKVTNWICTGKNHARQCVNVVISKLVSGVGIFPVGDVLLQPPPV